MATPGSEKLVNGKVRLFGWVTGEAVYSSCELVLGATNC